MNILKISLIPLLFAIQSVSAADQIAGKVVKVSDGDTVTLLGNGDKNQNRKKFKKGQASAQNKLY